MVSRIFYWLSGLAARADHSDALTTPVGVMVSKVASPELWKALVIPLSDSLVHKSNMQLLAHQAAPTVSMAVAGLLFVGHLWFWWRVLFDRRSLSAAPRLTALAVTVQLLFYALVAGVVIQRVPNFGFDYLHQGRYVLFYQLNLVALALLVYRQYRFAPQVGRKGIVARRAGVVLVVLAMAGLQFELNRLAWAYSHAVGGYVRQAAYQMGALAAHPEQEMACVPFLTVCRYPPEERRQLMSMLKSRRYNVFAPEFQLQHHLYPSEATSRR
jgi:hypothetical protein